MKIYRKPSFPNIGNKGHGRCCTTMQGSQMQDCAQFFGKNTIVFLDLQPYSPSLAPCDFWLFTRLKLAMKEAFNMILDIQRATTAIKKSL